MTVATYEELRIRRLGEKVNRLQARVRELEGAADLFEALFGRKLDYESLRLVGEVTEQAVGIRDRWEGQKPLHELEDALDDFVQAVNEMEGER